MNECSNLIVTRAWPFLDLGGTKERSEASSATLHLQRLPSVPGSIADQGRAFPFEHQNTEAETWFVIVRERFFQPTDVRAVLFPEKLRIWCSSHKTWLN